MRFRHVPRPLAAMLLGLAVLAAPAVGAPARAGASSDIRHGAHGAFHAPGQVRAGHAFLVFVDPLSGRVLAHDPPRARPHRLDRADVVHRLRWAGYTNISRPVYREGGYVVRADDRFGYRRLLQVDPHSGVIRRLREVRRPWW